MIDTEEIDCAREIYIEKFQGRFALDPEKVLSVKHAEFLLHELDKKNSRIVLELGCGFSTVLLRAWALESGARIITGDPNENILECLIKTYGYRDMFSIKRLKHPSFHDVLKSRCDCILVDHSNLLHDRIEDIPWMSTLVSRRGFMVFTDCRSSTNYVKHVERYLTAMKWSFSVIEETRESDTSALGIAIPPV